MISYFFEEIGRISLLTKAVFVLLVRSIIEKRFIKFENFRPIFTPTTRRIVYHLVNIGVNTLPILFVVSGFFGMVLAYLGYNQFRRIEMEIYTGALVGTSMLTEVGPVIAAVLIAGRIGSQASAEISSMKTTQQIDALETLAVNPIEYLVLPRFIATVLMMPVLGIFADAIGIMGGYVVGVLMFGLKSELYITKMLDFLKVSDLTYGLIKTIFFGAIIIIISCYKGFRAKEGAVGVGEATTSAVVVSIAVVLVADYFLTVILF
ncbi:TPA: ABC transporter permease [bacterium]|nr:ABC transporter permease [bacterium]